MTPKEFKSDLAEMVKIAIEEKNLNPSEVSNILLELSAIQAVSFLKEPLRATESFKQAIDKALQFKETYAKKTTK